MARNPYGIGPVSTEWGSKARKAENADRNLNHQADRAAIAEGLDEIFATYVDGEPSIADEGEPDWDDYWLEQRYEDLYAGTAIADDLYDADDFWYD